MNVINENKKIILNSDETKVIQAIKKDFKKFKGFIFAGIFSILVGLTVGLSALFLSMDGEYIVTGILFIIMGTVTLRDAIRNKKVYQLLNKLADDNQE